MARYHGRIGYATQVEIRPGVYEDVIEERLYFGTVTKDVAKWRTSGERLHKELTLSNLISVMADAYTEQNVHNIRYIEWMGTLWSIADVEIARPRLVIRLGGVYNGPEPEREQE